MDNLEHFSFTQFKVVMAIADIDEATYALILRAIFDQLLIQYEIDLSKATSISFDLTFAIYKHAKHLFEVHKNNLSVLDSVADSAGNRTSYKISIPTEVMSTYKMYSPVPLAII
jgi:hypothetical protein